MSVREAGRRGGEAVRAKYGREHYRRIGTAGGRAVDREHGRAFYAAIGKRGGAAVKQARGRAFYAEIGRKGGLAVRDTHGRDYYRRIGKIGGARRAGPSRPRGDRATRRPASAGSPDVVRAGPRRDQRLRAFVVRGHQRDHAY
jgi:hypothetical protein